jgi:hypothetical protein
MDRPFPSIEETHDLSSETAEEARAEAAAEEMSFREDPSFNRWLDTFLDEKGIDGEEILEAEGPSGTNWIPIACLVELMKAASESERQSLKAVLVRIDFVNGDVRHYLTHLAKAVAL